MPSGTYFKDGCLPVCDYVLFGRDYSNCCKTTRRQVPEDSGPRSNPRKSLKCDSDTQSDVSVFAASLVQFFEGGWA